jgi:hypothetical protein
MEAARTSETSVENYFTRQYIPEDNSELRTRRRENLKSHIREKTSSKTNGLVWKGKNVLLHQSPDFRHLRCFPYFSCLNVGRKETP